MSNSDAPNETVPVVGEALFQIDPPALLGAQCGACEQTSFPATDRCPFCRDAERMKIIQLPSRGTIYSYTISRIGAPGYAGPVPYGLGVVQLGTALRVTSLLTANPIERLQIGSPVRFAVVDVGGPENPMLSFSYALEQS